jgi:hypothetical protein
MLNRANGGRGGREDRGRGRGVGRGRGGRGGQGRSSPNFSDVEIDSLLDSIQVIKPLGRDEWDALLTIFVARNPSREGVTMKALKTRFRKIRDTEKPTGDTEGCARKTLAMDIQGEIYAKA